jgi:hypothetical protein
MDGTRVERASEDGRRGGEEDGRCRQGSRRGLLEDGVDGGLGNLALYRVRGSWAEPCTKTFCGRLK